MLFAKGAGTATVTKVKFTTTETELREVEFDTDELTDDGHDGDPAFSSLMMSAACLLCQSHVA